MRTPVKTEFWERVKALLKTKKITQKELAGKIDLKYSTLKFWLCYGYFPDVETACDIASTLGVTVEYLARGNKGRKYGKSALSIKKTAADIATLARRIEEKCLVQGQKD